MGHLDRIGSHEVLDTGVHGAGGDTLATDADIATHAAALDAHLAETLPVLLKGSVLCQIPTNAGWTEVVTGTGSTLQHAGYFRVNSGATASSKATLWANMEALANAISYSSPINLSKKFYFIFGCSRYYDVANAIARLQIKQVNTEGALSAKGIGLRVNNKALYGESYGTELGEVNLATNLAIMQEAQIAIVFDPATPKIEWYVNGVLKGTQSTAAKIPTGSIGSYAPMVLSITNGASASNSSWLVMRPTFWQGR